MERKTFAVISQNDILLWSTRYLYLVIVFSIYSYLQGEIYVCYFGIWEKFCQKLCKPSSVILVIVFLEDKWVTWPWVMGRNYWWDHCMAGKDPAFILSVCGSSGGTRAPDVCVKWREFLGQWSLLVSQLVGFSPLIFVIIVHVGRVPCYLEQIPFVASFCHNTFD